MDADEKAFGMFLADCLGIACSGWSRERERYAPRPPPMELYRKAIRLSTAARR